MAKEKIEKISIINENPILVEEDLGLLSYDQLSDKSRKDHQSIVETLDNQDNALCLVVLGAISLVVAVLFFILSFKRVRNKPAGLDLASLQFWIFVVCLAGGIALLVIGLIKVFNNLKLRNAYKKEIAAIAKLKDQMADNNQ